MEPKIAPKKAPTKEAVPNPLMQIQRLLAALVEAKAAELELAAERADILNDLPKAFALKTSATSLRTSLEVSK